MFDGTIMCFILVNVVAMALDVDEISEKTSDQLILINYILIGVFTGEMLIKMGIFGLKNYIQNSWNKYSFIILIIKGSIALLFPFRY